MLANKSLGAAPAAEPLFIEDTFSCFLYTGNGSTQTITNGIDLSGKGGMVWIKDRNNTGDPKNHYLYDTVRGTSVSLSSNTTSGNLSTSGIQLTAFNNNGFSLGSSSNVNQNTFAHVAWTFRKAPKFFDVVTWTGDGVAGRQIAHNLGSAPGAIIVKCTSIARDWAVWHNTLSNGTYLKLNTTEAVITNTSFQVFGDSSGQTSTVFTVGKSGAGVNGLTNASGDTYVAYLFAHNAGGFGLTGTDNVISCGSYTGNGASGQQITLGWETQWVMTKAVSTTSQWTIADILRGQAVEPSNSSNGNPALFANQSFAEINTATSYPTATGFNTGPNNNASGQTYIYIAIRRGPMRVPTAGTQVYGALTRTGTDAAATISSLSFPPDFLLSVERNNAVGVNGTIYDRLRGLFALESTVNSQAEKTGTDGVTGWDAMAGVRLGTDTARQNINYSGSNYAYQFFRRAPGFFDVVCYTGTGSATTFNHNLGVVPEMMIVKRRDSAADWWLYDTATGNTKYQVLNSTATPVTSSTAWNNTTPTSTVFTVGTGTPVNASAGTYVAYLFASVAGVSKVGSYTGTGTTKQIDCGFTGGARFVLIKRTDSTGGWYVWDTARGIVAGNDPYSVLNSTAAEVTSTDYIDTYSAGFEISSTAPEAINANGGTYIFLAIA